MNFKSILSTIAPLIGSALGGPLGGAAMSVVSEALLGKPDGDPSDIKSILKRALPEDMKALKAADEKFKLSMAELGIREKEIYASDRDSARKREASTGDSVTPRVLAGGITTGFFAVLAFIMFAELPAGNRDIIFVMLGSLGSAWIGVVTYYFGSSASSFTKNLILRKK